MYQDEAGVPFVSTVGRAADLAGEADGSHLKEVGPLDDAPGVVDEVRDRALLRART